MLRNTRSLVGVLHSPPVWSLYHERKLLFRYFDATFTQLQDGGTDEYTTSSVAAAHSVELAREIIIKEGESASTKDSP